MICAAMLGIGIGIVRHSVHPASVSAPIRSMAVLPLRNLSGDPAQEYFADGTTEELIAELARIPNLTVLSWSSVVQEKGGQKPLREIASDLHADAIVEGSIVRSGKDVRINAELIDTRTGKPLWVSSSEGEAADIVGLEDRTAQEIAAHARLAIAAPRPSLNGMQPPSPAVREACIRGRNYFDKRDGLSSAQAFQQAIDLAPNYAPAYTGLANALASQVLLGQAPSDATVPRAMAAAQRALELNPDDGDALIARGAIELTFLWKWKQAEADLLRGVSLSPSNSYGQMQLAVYYDAQGNVDEAVARMRHATELDPLSFFMARHYGSTLFYARRYDEALAQLQYARSMHPQAQGVVNGWISAVYQQQGKQDKAVQYDLLGLQAEQTHSNVALGAESPQGNVARLLSTYHRSGWSAYWALRSTLLQDNVADSCSVYFKGRVLLRAGRVDQGLSDLRQAASRHCYWTSMLPADPELDPYRNNPAFTAIVAKLGLSPSPVR